MRKITNELIVNFKERLIEEEKSPATVDKYVRDVTLFMAWCNNARLCKALVLEYKQMAVEKYAPASVNAIISSLNSFFAFMNWYDMRIKALKIQRQIFAERDKELTKA